jgi:hypothetical protein
VVAERTRRTLAALLAAAAIAGCGVTSTASGGPSPADPATVTPAGALAYLSLPARLGGAQGRDAAALLGRVFGSGATGKLQAQVEQLLSKRHLNYSRDVRPWLGGHVALVITHFPSLGSLLGAGLGTGLGLGAGSGAPGGLGVAQRLGRALIGDLAVVIPTSDPAAARAWLTKTIPQPPAGVSAVVHNRWMLIGGQGAVSAIETTDPGGSLARAAGYRAMVSRTGASTPAAAVYLNVSEIASDVRPLLSAAAASGGPAGGIANLYGHLLGMVPASGASLLEALSFDHSAVHLDGLSTGFPARKPGGADVGRLPADAWLALDTGAGNHGVPAGLRAELPRILQLGLRQTAGRLGRIGSGLAPHLAELEALYGEVLSATGPLSLAISGTSEAGAHLGVTLDSSNPAAAARLLTTLFTQLERKHPGRVHGSPSHFTFTTSRGQHGSVTDTAGQVVGLIGYPNAAAFTSPTATLASTPPFNQAKAQLPPGAAPELWVNFGPIATLASAQAKHASAQRAAAKLSRLGYLIVGSVPGDTRIVLGVR